MARRRKRARQPVGADGRKALGEILGQTADYLNWLKDEGAVHVEVARPIRRKEGVAEPGVRAASAEPPRDVAPRAVAGSGSRSLSEIAVEIAACRKCGLHKTRRKTVPGQGHPEPEILFIGEAPGADEDEQGLAFVGAAGQLLTKMIAAMGFQREEVFIANILKCRPPENRPPTPVEMETCIPYLKEQIQRLKPQVIVALGATAVRGLLKVETGITRLRGSWHVFEGIPVMPTFHPAYLLRNPPAKKEAWADLQAVLRRIGKTPPPVKPAGV